MSDTKKCPHCGKQIHSNAQYCMFCMTSLQPKQDITPSVRSGKKWITTAILLLTVVTILVLMLVSNCTAQPPKGQAPAGDAAEDTQLPFESSEPDEPISTEEIPTVENTESLTGSEPEIEINTDPRPNTDDDSTPNSNTDTNTDADNGSNIDTPVQQICNHYYIAANCLKPMTCTYCGDTVGTVDTSAHTWKPVTAVVHHEEVGHYEDVEVSYQKTVYLCFFCGYNQDGYDSLEALRSHMTVHSNKVDYNYVIGCPDLLADTREVWASRIEQQWVVDEEAYDETVTTGYICTICNKQKGS